jgi:N-sulfoglucosamine sulfohydrolase
LGHDSFGFTGCPIPNITPNLDSLARESYRFAHGHVTVASCQPSRQCLLTGRYPHNLDAPGFDPIREDVPTLPERLREAGYLNGILGKETHLQPRHKFSWDQFTPANQLGSGRSPERYYAKTKQFLDRAETEGKPFFLMANSHDPHRPFAGSADELRRWNTHLDVRRTFNPGEIPIPDFLPDLPEVRADLAYYFASVHRGDEAVGEILRALDDSGFADNTIVVYLSDNGMPMPFAKANCYLASTATPWLVRWPGVTRAGEVDRDHFVGGVDFVPTILEALGLAPESGLDGRSFASILEGGTQEKRDHVFTLFNRLDENRSFPMRCVQNKRYGYIWNAWAGQDTPYSTAYLKGPSYQGMKAAAAHNPAVRAREQMLLRRISEELYDFQEDPGALNSLLDLDAHRETLFDLRGRMYAEMKRSGDPLAEPFREFLDTPFGEMMSDVSD